VFFTSTIQKVQTTPATGHDILDVTFTFSSHNLCPLCCNVPSRHMFQIVKKFPHCNVPSRHMFLSRCSKFIPAIIPKILLRPPYIQIANMYCLSFCLVHKTLSLCSRVLLEKLILSQLVKKFPHFIENWGSLPHSKESSSTPCPEADQSSP